MQSRSSQSLNIDILVAHTRFAHLNRDRIPSPLPQPPTFVSVGPSSDPESPYLSDADMSSESAPPELIPAAGSRSPERVLSSPIGSQPPSPAPARPLAPAPSASLFGHPPGPAIPTVPLVAQPNAELNASASVAPAVTAAPRSASARAPQVPAFRGTEDEDAHAWLPSFTSAMMLNGINENNPVIFDYFRLAMSGVAQSWFMSLSPNYDSDRATMMEIARRNNSGQAISEERMRQIEIEARPMVLRDFALLRSAFLERFAPDIRVQAAQIQLMALNIRQFESVTELYEKMERLWSKCKPAPAESVKIEKFYNAIKYKPGYVTEIMSKKPVTVAQAFLIALAREAGEAMEAGLNGVPSYPNRGRDRDERVRNNPTRDRDRGYNNYYGSQARNSSGFRSSSVNAVGQDEFITRQEFSLAMNRVRDEMGSLTTKVDRMVSLLENRDRPGPRSAMAPSDSRGRERTCFVCNKTGHFANECPNNPDRNRGGRRGNDRRDRDRRGNSNAIGHGTGDDERTDDVDDQDFERKSAQEEERDEEYYPSDHDIEEKYEHDVINVTVNTAIEDVNVGGAQTSSSSHNGINAVSSARVQRPPANLDPESAEPVSKPLSAKTKLAGAVDANAVIDTGAGLTLMASRVFDKLPEAARGRLVPAGKRFRLTAANGQSLSKRGIVQLPLEFDEVKIKPLRFIVIDNLANDILIGNDHLRNPKLFGDINVARGTVQYLGNATPQVLQAQALAVATSTTSTSKPAAVKAQTGAAADGSSSAPMRASSDRKPRHKPRETNPEHAIGSVRLLKNVVIAPRSEITIPAAETKVRGVGHFRDSYVQPRRARFGSKYQHPVIVLDKHPALKASVRVVHTLCDVTDQLLDGSAGVPLHLANPTNQPITLRRNTRVAVAEALDRKQIGATNSVFPSERIDPVHSSH